MVLVVNEHDQVLYTADKWQAHVEGLLHRAFSILIFNRQGEWLLQQRATEKYHSGGLWSNSCCGHPTQPMNLMGQASQRVDEELGIRTRLEPLFCFRYRAEVGTEMVENEIDHVFIGFYEGPIPFNRAEVAAIRWVGTETIQRELHQQSANFTPWFRLLYEHVTSNYVWRDQTWADRRVDEKE